MVQRQLLTMTLVQRLLLTMTLVQRLLLTMTLVQRLLLTIILVQQLYAQQHLVSIPKQRLLQLLHTFHCFNQLLPTLWN